MPDVAPLQSADPTQVAGYRLTGRIGAGGQGVVYLGVSPDNELVAVKLLRMDDDRSREQFAKEVAAARRVAPFCTAQILDFDMESQPPYVISEFIEGPSLQQYVSERGPMSGTRLQRLAIGTATALAAIHQAGVVHRDLKPANVMMSPEGPRVIDFGIARDLSNDTTKVSKLFGTPAYMSPEQLRGERVGPATDLFAWGSVMAFAATGRAPFEAEHMMAAINKIAHEEPDLTGVPAELLSVLRRCFSKDAARRPTAQHALSMLLGRPDETDAPDPTQVLAQATQLVEASSTGPTTGYAEGRTAIADTGSGAGRRPTGTSGPVSPGVPSEDVPPWGTPVGYAGRSAGTAQGQAPSAFQQGGQYSPPSAQRPQQYQPPAPAPAPSPQSQWGSPGQRVGTQGFGGPQGGQRPASQSWPPHSQPANSQTAGYQPPRPQQPANPRPAAYQPPRPQQPASPQPVGYQPPQPQQPQWGPPSQQPSWGQKGPQGQQLGQRGPVSGPQPPMPGPAQRAGVGGGGRSGPALPPPGPNNGWSQPPAPQPWGGSNGGHPGGVPGRRPGAPAPDRGRFVVLSAAAVLTLLVGVGIYNFGDQGADGLNDQNSSSSSESGGSKDAADPEACGGRINVGADQGDDSDCETADASEDAAVQDEGKDKDKQAPAGTLPYELEGTWEGQVSQYSGTVNSWKVRLDLKGGKKKAGTMEAVDLGCRSKVTVTGVALTAVTLRAPVKKSDNPGGVCAPLGEVILLQDPIDSDKATFTWQDLNSAGNVGSAQLTRVD